MVSDGIGMVTSAELRWFWRGRCLQPVYDWFFNPVCRQAFACLIDVESNVQEPRYILPLPCLDEVRLALALQL